jgi:hypothetical protein
VQVSHLTQQQASRGRERSAPQPFQSLGGPLADHTHRTAWTTHGRRAPVETSTRRTAGTLLSPLMRVVVSPRDRSAGSSIATENCSQQAAEDPNVPKSVPKSE